MDWLGFDGREPVQEPASADWSAHRRFEESRNPEAIEAAATERPVALQNAERATSSARSGSDRRRRSRRIRPRSKSLLNRPFVLVAVFVLVLVLVLDGLAWFRWTRARPRAGVCGLERSSAFRGESKSRSYRSCCDRETGRAPKCGARDVLGAQRIGPPASIQENPTALEISPEPSLRPRRRFRPRSRPRPRWTGLVSMDESPSKSRRLRIGALIGVSRRVEIPKLSRLLRPRDRSRSKMRSARRPRRAADWSAHRGRNFHPFLRSSSQIRMSHGEELLAGETGTGSLFVDDFCEGKRRCL